MAFQNFPQGLRFRGDLRNYSGRVLLFLIVAVGIAVAQSGEKLVVYPELAGLPKGTDFSVKVRQQDGGKWLDLQTYLVKVTAGLDVRAQEERKGEPSGPQDSSMASFDFSGKVEVAVTYTKGDLRTARIRPLSYGIPFELKGNTITFSLDKPRNLSIEINGDIFHNLQLFANPLETAQPKAGDANVLYYGPGLHRIGRMEIPSNSTVYLAPGAVVQGAFLMNHVENVHIFGRGVLYQLPLAPGSAPAAPAAKPGQSARRDALLIEYSRNVKVEGITVVTNSYTVLVGQAEKVRLRNLKSFSAGGNNDGIDIFSSSDVLVDGVFMRNSDDNIAIYGHRWSYYGDTRNVTVQNSTLWADVAHPILVGTHGDSEKPETLEELHFRNIDIVDQRELQMDYQGCMSLNAGDSNLIRKVSFEDIRVEDFRVGQLINLRVFFNEKYNTSAGRGIEDVLFRNVSYQGSRANPSILSGYDDARAIRNIVFEDLKLNGRVITDDMAGKPGFYKTSDMASFFVGNHVKGITFRRSPGQNSVQ